jgi:hypothetical protein
VLLLRTPVLARLQQHLVSLRQQQQQKLLQEILLLMLLLQQQQQQQVPVLAKG